MCGYSILCLKGSERLQANLTSSENWNKTKRSNMLFSPSTGSLFERWLFQVCPACLFSLVLSLYNPRNTHNGPLKAMGVGGSLNSQSITHQPCLPQCATLDGLNWLICSIWLSAIGHSVKPEAARGARNMSLVNVSCNKWGRCYRQSFSPIQNLVHGLFWASHRKPKSRQAPEQRLSLLQEKWQLIRLRV